MLDRHIRHQQAREGAPRPFQRFPTWMWRNPVVARLMHDLHALNRDRPADAMVGFYGLDIYNIAGSIEAVLAYLDEHDPEAASIARERYGCLTPWQAEAATYGRAALTKGYAECERQVIAECRDLLDRVLGEDATEPGACWARR